MNDITIIIPAYHEEKNIAAAIKEIEATVTPIHTIMVVCDEVSDPTIPVVKELCKYNHNIKIAMNRHGRGAWQAIKTGIEDTTATYIVVTNADLSDPPFVINEMYNIAEETTADIVCASRYMKGGTQAGGPFVKMLLSRMASLALYYLVGLPTHDATNGHRLYRTSYIKEVSFESNGFEYVLEIIVKAHFQGCKIEETPTQWKERVSGESTFQLFGWLGDYLKWFFWAFAVRLSLVFKKRIR
jgi:glycosyltransferase involved in cell wall biosynthesis